MSVAVGSVADVVDRQDSDAAARRDAQHARLALRAARVSAGLEELDQWLCDRIRAGLAELEHTGHAELEAMAARMVDAQAPGVATRLRRLPAVLASGEGRYARALEQFALLRLLVRAHRRLGVLPARQAAAVRAHVGYPIPRSEVLAGAAVRDTWAVIGLRDTVDDRLLSRRVWLLGSGTGLPALVLSYAPPGQQLDDSLVPGTAQDADLHFYPSGVRALVGVRHGDAGLLPRLATAGIDEALDGWADALAADPWTPSWPMLLGAVTPVRDGERWLLRDVHGDGAAGRDGGNGSAGGRGGNAAGRRAGGGGNGKALPLAAPLGKPWRLLAVSGGAPVTVAGEWSAEGFTPWSVLRRQELVTL